MREEKNCPCCPNHCNIDNLSCGKGRAYFSEGTNEMKEEKSSHMDKDESSMTTDEKVVSKIRKCGHFLHHGGREVSLDFLSDDEKENLITILSKCLDNWE